MITEGTNSNICYICGDRAANTRDHLFPISLFNTPAPSNLPRRLLACEECNNGLSKDEELFRVFLATGMAYESNAGNRIWTERIRPALQGERKGLKPLIRSMVKKASVISKSGEHIENVHVLSMQREPINRVLSKIAKGLYYLDTQQVLPSEVEILTGYHVENPDIFAPPLDDAIKSAKKTVLGNGEVTYWRNTIKDNPEESLTWIRFCEDKIFLICTTRQNAYLG